MRRACVGHEAVLPHARRVHDYTGANSIRFAGVPRLYDRADRLSLAQLYIVVFVEGTAYVFFSIAQISALPQVVSKEHLPRAYALDTTTEYVGQLVGPSLAGFIIGLAPVVALGAALAYLLDSLSYLASVITLRFMKVSFQVERQLSSQRHDLRKEIIEGLRFLWQQPILRIMVILATSGNFLLSSITLAVIVMAQGTLHLNVQILGLILASGGIGGVLGGFGTSMEVTSGLRVMLMLKPK